MQALKEQLILAYSEDNLNTITAKILQFYKEKQSNPLKQICKLVNEFYSFPYQNSSKLFSKLVMLYHPDKLNEYQRQIKECNSKDLLEQYSHILPVLNFLENGVDSYITFKTPEEFEEEYGWNYQSTDDDYFMVREDDDTINPWFDEENQDSFSYMETGETLPEGSFLASLKRKIYGPTHIDFPVHLLEDLEEIEMAEYEIDSLEGIEFCTYVKIIDLSYNELFDITKLEHCAYIQELYLSNNSIHYIDSICHMPNLRVLDLSNNQVEDISPILNSKSLEFINLLGNPVPLKQINQLKELGVAVVF